MTEKEARAIGAVVLDAAKRDDGAPSPLVMARLLVGLCVNVACLADATRERKVP